MPKNATQLPQVGLEPGLLNPVSSALPSSSPCLSHHDEVITYKISHSKIITCRINIATDPPTDLLTGRNQLLAFYCFSNNVIILQSVQDLLFVLSRASCHLVTFWPGSPSVVSMPLSTSATAPHPCTRPNRK